jgi:hypothetical protein
MTRDMAQDLGRSYELIAKTKRLIVSSSERIIESEVLLLATRPLLTVAVLSRVKNRALLD